VAPEQAVAATLNRCFGATKKRCFAVWLKRCSIRPGLSARCCVLVMLSFGIGINRVCLPLTPMTLLCCSFCVTSIFTTWSFLYQYPGPLLGVWGWDRISSSSGNQQQQYVCASAAAWAITSPIAAAARSDTSQPRLGCCHCVLACPLAVAETCIALVNRASPLQPVLKLT
jgi:hypothetical protein